MPSLTGSSPASRPPSLRAGLVVLGLLLASVPGTAAMPDYVRDALGKFNTEVPAGWAYTLTTVRNSQDRTTARFDPAKPPAEQWTLQQ